MIPRPHPTRVLVAAVLLTVILAVISLWDSRAIALLVIANSAIATLAMIDLLLTLLAARRLEVRMQAPRIWSLARPEHIDVELWWRGRLPLHLSLLPDLSHTVQVEDGATQLRIPGRRRAQLRCIALAHERGRYDSAGVHVAMASPLGCWNVHLLRGNSISYCVYPNLRRASEYALLARTNRLGLIGVRSALGSGNVEFERLRPFASGDPLTRIDWKATARLDRPVVREFRSERNQNIVFVVDCGRMLTGRSWQDHTGEQLLDRSIDAALLLAHVALKQGDRVGLIAYDAVPRRSVPLAGGSRQFAHLIHALHDLRAEPVESRHDLAFLHLRQHVRQRALVVHISALLDDVNAHMMRRHLESMVGRHLPLAVFLRQPAIFHPLRTPPENPERLLQAGAAAHIANWRAGILRQLDAAGVLTLDCELDELDGGLVSRYLDIKARRLL